MTPPEKQLSAELLLWGYSNGIFPMAVPEFNNQIFWFDPEERAVMPIEEFHCPKSLRRVVRSGKFQVCCDRDFEGVIRGCAAPRGEGEDASTWISEEIIESYCELFQLGYAHSVECYQEDRLVGGLYGVALGGVFFGESMFHTVRDASKVALVKLVEHLRRRGYQLLDIQFMTDHLARFGAYELTREEFQDRLRKALDLPCEWGEFEG